MRDGIGASTNPGPGVATSEFIQNVRFEQIPAEVVAEAVRCLVDTLGVAMAGTSTHMSTIARNHAVEAFGAGSRGSRILFDGRVVSPVGAAMAGASTIDSVDAHDGHVLTKGHAGAALIPALFAFADSNPQTVTGQELLTRLVMGYEISTRAGIALHQTAKEYHTSGAWNALGCAAIGARAYGLGTEKTFEALGIAEYHGPRSEMMRCIDAPTMVKDGSMWGATSGVSATMLAAAGYTGAPAVTVSGEAVKDVWSDLGERWFMAEQYLKPQAVCRWAQPAVQAVIDLMQAHGLTEDRLRGVQVATFAAGLRLATRHPQTTEEAQYSLPFSVANAIVHADIPVPLLLQPTDVHPRVRHWMDTMEFIEVDDFTARFPAERLAVVTLHLDDGSSVQSEPTAARGGSDSPLSDSEVFDKFRSFTSTIVGPQRSEELLHMIINVQAVDDSSDVLDAVLTGVG